MVNQGVAADAASERRNWRLRIEPKDLVYLPLLGDLAFILNVSEGGMAVQAMEVLEAGRSVEFALPLPDTKAELTGVAEIVWADRSGRAGLKFANLSPLDRLRLIEWLIRSYEQNRINPSSEDSSLDWN